MSIDSISSLLDDLREGREVQATTPVLGVESLDVSIVEPDVIRRFDVTATAGAFVQRVPGSGAEAAGLQAGDVVVGVDDRRIRSAADVGQAVRAKAPGDEIVITFERGAPSSNAVPCSAPTERTRRGGYAPRPCPTST